MLDCVLSKQKIEKYLGVEPVPNVDDPHALRNVLYNSDIPTLVKTTR